MSEDLFYCGQQNEAKEEVPTSVFVVPKVKRMALRFKTRQEMIDDYGSDHVGNPDVMYGWNREMNALSGRFVRLYSADSKGIEDFDYIGDDYIADHDFFMDAPLESATQLVPIDDTGDCGWSMKDHAFLRQYDLDVLHSWAYHRDMFTMDELP